MGNRQGGKTATRQDLSYRNRRETGRGGEGSNVDVDPRSTEYHPTLFHSVAIRTSRTFASLPSSPVFLHMGGEASVPAFEIDSTPKLAAEIPRQEIILSSCLEDASRNHTNVGGSVDVTDLSCSVRTLHSPSAVKREILKSSNFQNRQDICQEECEVSSAFFSVSALSKQHSLETDTLVKAGAGEKSSAAVAMMAADCIDRLEKLKKNIEQSNTQNFTHFNNAGFAQLQSENQYDDYDNAYTSIRSETCMRRRSKSMSPKTAVWCGLARDKNKSSAVRKLSEPSKFIHRVDNVSLTDILPGAWSKSAENSPIIVRKALPRPDSPVIVQRTPSQSPSVERRFPANASAGSVLSGKYAALPEGPSCTLHPYQKIISKHPAGLETREASHTIRQKANAEISVPHFSYSPISVRKMPESPILHYRKNTKTELSSHHNTNVPVSVPSELSRVDHARAFTASSCSSSSSESAVQKLPLQEDNVQPFIPPGTSSTSSMSAVLCASSPTPIQFCPQPKGTPVRTCTMVSQPSTAVVLASRDSDESFQAADVTMQFKGDSNADGETTDIKKYDDKKTQNPGTKSHKESSSSAVTEDTIKENSQSAVFGSVSPKLLRHRRLMKDSSNSPHSQHTLPKQSQGIQFTATRTSPKKGESALVDMHDFETLAHLSQSAPSSFTIHRINSSATCAGNKTLGQRIREVITEASSGQKSNTETSLSYGKHEKIFTKDVSFPCTVQDTQLLKNISYSYHLRSSRDSCSSCFSDSSQLDESPYSHREVAELTKANLFHQSELFSADKESKPKGGLSSQFGVSGQSLVTSDTSDTLSTDRETSSSSKRESSTSTATDDTLTSFKTRSTADSADYEDSFVLPKSLVFVRSAHKEEENDICGFESEQMTVKRKLTPGHVPKTRVDHEPLSHKTRKKRRKQLHVQSQIVTASESILKQNLTDRDVYSDDISDDSDIFGSKDDISDFPSSRDDISDLPSSRDDISDLPSSRDDISDLLSSRDNTSGLPNSRRDVSSFGYNKHSNPGGFSSSCDFSDVCNTSAQVFHRSDLHSSNTPTPGSPVQSRSMARKPAPLYRTFSEQSDSDVNRTLTRRRSSSQDSSDTFVNVSEMHHVASDSRTVLSEDQPENLRCEKQCDSSQDVHSSPSSWITPHKRLMKTAKMSDTASDQEQGIGERFEDRNLSPVHSDKGGGCDEGKELFLQHPDSPEKESTVVFPYTIYNSACQNVDKSAH